MEGEQLYQPGLSYQWRVNNSINLALVINGG